MTALRDPFDITHTKRVETKTGSIDLTYISWSQVADRLDEAAPGWSFTIRQIGDDWCWGTLTFDGRAFDNIGYAENADQAWKKEALKDAVSDALKRCAALAGVGRYLYDKDTTSAHGPGPVRTATAAGGSPPSRPAAVANPYGAPKPHDDPYPDDLSDLDAGPGQCLVHNVDFRLVPAGTSKRTGKVYDAFWSCPEMGCKERPR